MRVRRWRGLSAPFSFEPASHGTRLIHSSFSILSHREGMIMRQILLALPLLTIAFANARAQVPEAIAAKGETAVAIFHAEGAQVYECKASADGKLGWAFREPIASLLLDGKTVGRHYAGPSWEHTDGSAVVGKAVGTVPGATPNDIPLLKLEVISRRGSGVLSGVTTVQRINTKGGKFEGACD